LRGGIAIL